MKDGPFCENSQWHNTNFYFYFLITVTFILPVTLCHNFLSHFVIPVTICNNFISQCAILVTFCNNFLSHSVITIEWIGTQDLGPRTGDSGPDTQIPESRTEGLDRTRRTKNPDPGPKICDLRLSSIHYTQFGHVLHEWFFSYGNIHHLLILILILNFLNKKLVKELNFSKFT